MSSSPSPPARGYLARMLRLLGAKERRALTRVLGLMLVGMVFESFSISLIVPAVALMTRDDLMLRPFLQPYLAMLGHPTQTQLVIGVILAMVAAFLVKTVLIGVLIWQQTSLSYRVRAALSQQLFAGYLQQPWTFHLQRNSATLIRNVIREADEFSVVVQSVLIVASEGLVLFGLGVLLLLFEPIGAVIVVSTMAAAALAFYSVFRGHTLRWGRDRQRYEASRLQHLQQGLGGAKEVKVLGREAEFMDRYNQHNKLSAAAGQRQVAVQQYPRLLIENLAVVGLAALVLTMIAQGRPLFSLVTTLSLFGAAAFRLMPSFNRIVAAMQQLRFRLPVVNTLDDEIHLIAPPAPAPGRPLPPLSRSVALEHVTYHYPGAATVALDDINLVFAANVTIGVVGESGAGKSTLVDLILGLLAPTSGRVLIDGVNYVTNLRGWQNQIGYVPQTIYLTDDTLRRNVAFGVPDAEIDDAAVRRAMAAAQLETFVAGLPEGLETMVGERGVRLSGGQRQRVGIARALYHNPAILVLDEATSALDTATEEEVMAAVRELHGSRTVVIVAHRHSTVSHCDSIFRLRAGQLVDETTGAAVAAEDRHPRLSRTPAAVPGYR